MLISLRNRLITISTSSGSTTKVFNPYNLEFLANRCENSSAVPVCDPKNTTILFPDFFILSIKLFSFWLPFAGRFSSILSKKENMTMTTQFFLQKSIKFYLDGNTLSFFKSTIVVFAFLDLDEIHTYMATAAILPAIINSV